MSLKAGADNSRSQYRLYAADLSLFSGKLRAYLNYKQLNFEEITASIWVYRNVIVPKTGVRFIPVLETPDGEFLQDTAATMDILEHREPKRSIIPDGARQRVASMLFELLGDEWLVLPAMHYRWNKQQEDYIYGKFGANVLPGWPRFVQRWIGKKVGAKFRGFVAPLGISQDTIPELEAWYETDFLPQLDRHFATHQYLLGDRPCTGDFGLFGPLYAHLYLDPVPGEIMRRTAPNVTRWVETLLAHPKPTQPELGDWLANDEVPDTLQPILQRLFAECWPTLWQACDALTELRETSPDAKIPRLLKMGPFTLGSAQGERFVLSFSQWKLQRVLACYQQVAEDDKESVDAWLQQVGAGDALQQPIPHPVARKRNKLHWQDKV